MNNFINFYHIPNDSSSLKDNLIWDIYQDNQSKLWITTEQGIHIFLSNETGFEQIHISKYEEQLKEVRTIFHD